MNDQEENSNNEKTTPRRTLRKNAGFVPPYLMQNYELDEQRGAHSLEWQRANQEPPPRGDLPNVLAQFNRALSDFRLEDLEEENFHRPSPVIQAMNAKNSGQESEPRGESRQREKRAEIARLAKGLKERALMRAQIARLNNSINECAARDDELIKAIHDDELCQLLEQQITSA